MSEVQEKVWVVMKTPDVSYPRPIKVFDDRKDAREFAKRFQVRAKTSHYWVMGVKKG